MLQKTSHRMLWKGKPPPKWQKRLLTAYIQAQ
jgi:hypothetical protein